VGALERPVTTDGSPIGRQRRKSTGSALVGLHKLSHSGAASAYSPNIGMLSPSTNTCSIPREGRPGRTAWAFTATRPATPRSCSNSHTGGGDGLKPEQPSTLPSLENRPPSRTAQPKAQKVTLLIPTESGMFPSRVDLSEVYGPWFADKDVCMAPSVSSAPSYTSRGSSSKPGRPASFQMAAQSPLLER